MNNFPSTRSSLLIRVRDGQDGLAWSEFVELYTPLLYRGASLGLGLVFGVQVQTRFDLR